MELACPNAFQNIFFAGEFEYVSNIYIIVLNTIGTSRSWSSSISHWRTYLKYVVFFDNHYFIIYILLTLIYPTANCMRLLDPFISESTTYCYVYCLCYRIHSPTVTLISVKLTLGINHIAVTNAWQYLLEMYSLWRAPCEYFCWWK